MSPESCETARKHNPPSLRLCFDDVAQNYGGNVIVVVRIINHPEDLDLLRVGVLSRSLLLNTCVKTTLIIILFDNNAHPPLPFLRNKKTAYFVFFLPPILFLLPYVSHFIIVFLLSGWQGVLYKRKEREETKRFVVVVAAVTSRISSSSSIRLRFARVLPPLSETAFILTASLSSQ